MSNQEFGDEVGHDVQWYLDPDGTEWFAEDGVRYELADDGFAYPVVGGSTDPTGATPLEVVADDDHEHAHEAVHSSAAADAPSSPFAPGASRASDEAADEADDVEHDGVDATPSSATVHVTVGRTEDGHVTTEHPDHADPAYQAHRTGKGERADVEPLLALQGLDAGYGSLPVLKGVDLEIRPGETAVLLGLNGAGKTTTAWTICGALSPWKGEIQYDGRDVGGWNTGQAVSDGVVMVPEGRRVFPDLSVGRNLAVGAWGKRKDRDYVHAQRERVFDYFPRLRERVDQLAGTLSGGEQQMLAIGRGIMADPRLLIIDEASMGLAPVIVKDVFDIISQINQDGVTVLLIEQNVGALEVADVGYVMEQGHMVRVLEGEELRDPAVVSEALMG